MHWQWSLMWGLPEEGAWHISGEKLLLRGAKWILCDAVVSSTTLVQNQDMQTLLNATTRMMNRSLPHL